MSVTPAVVVTAITNLQNAVTTAGTLQGADASTLAPVVLAAIALNQTIAAQIAANDLLIGTAPASLASGANPANAAAYLMAQIAIVQTQANLLAMQGFANRIGLNLAVIA